MLDTDDEEGMPVEESNEALGKRVKAFHLDELAAQRDPPPLNAIAAALGVNVKAVIAAVEDTPRLYLDGDEEKPEECCVYYEDGR